MKDFKEVLLKDTENVVGRGEGARKGGSVKWVHVKYDDGRILNEKS